jgi:hypothetical protein
LAVKLSNQRSETDPKHISNEKLQIIYKKLLDKKSKPRSTKELRESNLRTKLALEFDFRTNGLYDHSNALSLLLEHFKRCKYVPSMYNERVDVPLSEHDAILSCLLSLRQVDLTSHIPQLSEYSLSLLKKTAQYDRELLSYPNDVYLFGETKIDKYLSRNESTITVYHDDVFELDHDAEEDTRQSTTTDEREKDLMNLLTQFDQTPLIDETLLMEQDPVVQHRLLETETSLYGALVNPRAPTHTIEVALSIPELPELPDDISKFSLFTREVELASEFTSLANMHKELDLSKFLQDESQIGRASYDVLETFETDNDTLHDLWLLSLNRENTKLAARSWDGSCTTDKSALKKNLLSFEESDITLKIRDECHTDPVLNRTMAHYKHDVEHKIKMSNLPVALDGLPSLVDDVLNALLKNISATDRATVLRSVTWSTLREELIQIDLLVNEIQQSIDHILGGPLETHKEADILDLSKREEVPASDDSDLSYNDASDSDDEFYDKYYAQLDADEETAAMNEFPKTPVKPHTSRQDTYNYSFFTHMSLKDQLGHLMEHDHSMIERAFAVTLEELVQTIRATVLNLPESVDLTLLHEHTPTTETEVSLEPSLTALKHVWQDPWPLELLPPVHIVNNPDRHRSPQLSQVLHAQMIPRLQLIRDQSRVIAGICTSSPVYITANAVDDIDAAVEEPETPHASERGPRLLSYLYNQAQEGDDYGFSHLLLRRTFTPYCKMIEEWLCHGKCWSDYFAEFFIVKAKHKPARDAEYWTKAFTKRDELLPVFLKEFEDLIYKTGLVVNMFKDIQNRNHSRSAVNALPKYLDLANKFLVFDQFNTHLTGESAIASLIGTEARPSAPVPLDLLLRESLGSAIAEHHRLVNRLHLDSLTNDMQMRQHFASLKFYYFGYFAELFYHNLNLEMIERTMRTHGSIEAIMTSIRVMFKRRKMEQLFNVAVDRSLGQITTSDKDVLTNLNTDLLCFVPQGDYAQPTSNDIFGTCQLNYTCPWPLNVIVNQDALHKYHRVFALLFKLKRAARSLNEIWSAFQYPSRKRKAMSQHSLSIELMRQEMYHFVVTLQNYLTNQISDVSWNEFQHNLTKVESFEDVIDVHTKYIDAVITRCMLNDPAKPIQVTLDRILAAVHLFYEQVDQYLKTEGQEPNTALLVGIQSTKLEFRQCGKFLFTIVSALSHKGYKYDLTDLLVNLNYNLHYDKLTIK